MTNVLAVTLQAMQNDAARLEQAGMNLANALTPGYKRAVVNHQAPIGTFAQQLAGSAAASTAQATPAAPATVATDLRAGTLKATGQPLDVALDGGGFFEVTTDAGPAYTRQGNFRTDAQGRLVTTAGHAVMGRSGEITRAGASPQISETGVIRDARTGEVLAQLKIVLFDDPSQLLRLGDGLLSGGGMAPRLAGDGETMVRQGFLENSNVGSIQEMTHLIQAMRHFESMQRVAQGYDEMLGTAIRKLGEAG